MSEVFDQIAIAITPRAVIELQLAVYPCDTILECLVITDIANNRLPHANRKADFEGGSGINFCSTERIQVGDERMGGLQQFDIGFVDECGSQRRLVDGM